jgi:O-antigen ligase
MFNYLIKFILVLLFLFTPIAFGSVELWAFSLMELGILFMILLWSVQWLLRPALRRVQDSPEPHMVQGELRIPKLKLNTHNSKLSTIFIFLFLLLVLFQMIPLPSGVIKVLSPQTYELRNSLSTFNSQLLTLNSKFSISFVPFVTRIEFLKWGCLAAFFLFLLQWKPSNGSILNLIPLIMWMGIAESLYGMFEFFSGHHHILNLGDSSLASSVTGTFINRNSFAGYLLMVIPLSTGYLFSRESFQESRFKGWRHRLSSLDGKVLLIVFGIMVMIVGLLFSASRMGILSLLLSFSLISLLFRDPRKEKGFSKTSVLILGLALLWAAWVGLDAVISRFFSVSEGFEERWKIWVSTFQIFKDFPLLGSGLGTFTQVFPMYRSFHVRGLFTHAENDFLQLGSEVGLIGIGILLILFIILFSKAISGIHSRHPRNPRRYIGIAGLIGILALMFHSLVERNIQVPANAFLFTFIWALVLKISVGEKRNLNKLSEVTQ